MTIERQKLRWNGWGWIDAPDILGERADAVWSWMAQTMGADTLPHTPAVSLDDIEVPESRLTENQLQAIKKMTAPERVKTDRFERAFHARGKSYPDLIHLRSGNLEVVPDAVVYPENREEVLAIVQYAAQNNLALVPYGGGSSVVGGVNALPGGKAAVLTLDITRMNRVIEIDETARTARIQAGAYGPYLEEQLQQKGYTLGHYPQSFEFSTLGGWIAHRGAGQQSNRYGKAEEWLVSAELATPNGFWNTEAFPASAAGPQLTDLVAGSEGCFGVITQAEVHIHPLPEKKDYRGYLFMDWQAALDAARALAQSEIPTAMIRLSDPDESYFFQTLKTIGEEDAPTIKFSAMILGIEGPENEVDHHAQQAKKLLEEHGAMHLGEEPGQSWMKNRFTMPYLRDPMLDRGLAVDTLETAVRWSNLPQLHQALHETLRQSLKPAPDHPDPVVMAHISHCYPDGASLYFTFAFKRDETDPIAQRQRAKHKACQCILEHNATLSHHHGIGTDHRDYLAQEKGETNIALLRSVKKQLDEGGALNPGKLIPE